MTPLISFFIEYEHTGVMNAPVAAVEVDLTDDQQKKLAFALLGIDRGKQIYETIESISLIPEP